MKTDEYPTGFDLETIRNWNFDKLSIQDFLEYIKYRWHWPDWGYELKGKKVLRLELHTGGWSGNESLIDAIANNFVFWVMCWEKSTRGGHYYFKIRLKAFTK